MKKIITLLFFLITTFIYSQRIEYYNYGYDGIEKVKSIIGTDSIVIYSSYNARPFIKDEVCETILKDYKKLKNGKYIVISNTFKVVMV